MPEAENLRPEPVPGGTARRPPAAPSAGSKARSGVLDRRRAGGTRRPSGPASLDGKSGHSERKTWRRTSSTSARHRVRTRLRSPSAAIRAAPVRARKTAAMRGEAGCSILELPGPKPPQPAKRASTTPCGRVPAMIVRISGAASMPLERPRALNDPPLSQNQPAPIRLPSHDQSRKIQARRCPQGPAKTGAPDARSGRPRVSQSVCTLHRRHSPFKSPAQGIIRAHRHLRSSTEPREFSARLRRQSSRLSA